ncbi:hypothetical protein IKG33_01660 [Candidatus Saccharibacteria bacterium]|nr:hypothetical protein [Candidatus Saccharibacteria bacterium]
MDKNVIIELEKYIFEHKTKPIIASHMMADIIGVIIGVKPATISSFNNEEFTDVNPDELIELLDQVGLRILFFKQIHVDRGEITYIEDIYISRDTKTAFRLHQAFEKLHSSMDDMGQILDQKLWEESSREIGHLLGYPETAVEYYIVEQDVDNEERQQLMKRYQFYVHSPKNHEQEYQIYDQKIYQALRDYAPKTAEILINNRNAKMI